MFAFTRSPQFIKKFVYTFCGLYIKEKKLDDKLKAMMETEFEKMSEKINLFFVSKKRKLVREIEKKIELEEGLMDNLIEELLEEQKQLEDIKDKIMRNRIVEELNIKVINKEMLNEVEIFEVEQKLFGMSYRIMNAICWGYQKELRVCSYYYHYVFQKTHLKCLRIMFIFCLANRL